MLIAMLTSIAMNLKSRRSALGASKLPNLWAPEVPDVDVGNKEDLLERAKERSKVRVGMRLLVVEVNWASRYGHRQRSLRSLARS